MKRIGLLLLSFAASWLGIVVYAYFQMGRLEPVTDPTSGAVIPPPLSGLAEMGRRVYAANGCVYCHSQEVRPASISSDIELKLGPRRTVARDYLREQPAFPGYLRIGPDLANYGLRAPAIGEIHRMLYQPGSIMPSYRGLYEVRPISGQPAWDALTGLTGPAAPPPGYQVVPTAEARALAAYLLSLREDYAP